MSQFTRRTLDTDYGSVFVLMNVGFIQLHKSVPLLMRCSLVCRVKCGKFLFVSSFVSENHFNKVLMLLLNHRNFWKVIPLFAPFNIILEKELCVYLSNVMI